MVLIDKIQLLKFWNHLQLIYLNISKVRIVTSMILYLIAFVNYSSIHSMILYSNLLVNIAI